MADFSLKANDRLPSIRAVLITDGAPVDLTDATSVNFIMRPAKGAGTTLDAPAVIVDPPTAGGVRYDWAVGDTTTPGSYQAEWEVVWGDGRPQTFPTRTYHTIEILADLDGGV